ncbi:MAG: NYN domain-containing protein [Gammaproteobacteria bacterium]|nr:NYN domain-containing protein [Gammaproteobacteria bacterium]
MRTAVFVDAGYLFSAGSKLLSGNALPRSSFQLDLNAALQALRRAAEASSPSSSLLRIYWYDGMPRTGPTAEQQALADANDVKLRLGGIGYTGRQKGVDSLIVTDLIELARNHAISDAVLLSGDEDVRIGVQIAQTYGVRVHLLGIQPSGDNQGNQSRLLRQESDTSTEWCQPDIETFLDIGQAQGSILSQTEQRADEAPNATKQLDSVADDFVRARSPTELAALSTLDDHEGIPAELDRVLLRGAADVLGRRLDSLERHQLRQTARRLATEVNPSAGQTRPSDSTAELEADRIRRYAKETIIDPARRQGFATITIRAGDVAKSMNLQHNTPNVVGALRSRKFEKLAGVTVTDTVGPETGPNTKFTYAIDDSPRIASHP